MNRDLLSVVVHSALHAWESAPSAHVEIGEHIATAAMHSADGTIYVCSIVEVRRPADQAFGPPAGAPLLRPVNGGRTD